MLKLTTTKNPDPIKIAAEIGTSTSARWLCGAFGDAASTGGALLNRLSLFWLIPSLFSLRRSGSCSRA
jgi:hypothetical protein